MDSVFPVKITARSPLSKPTFLIVLGVLLISTIASGCSFWKKSKESNEVRLPSYRMSPDAVALELAVAQIGHEQVPILERMWTHFDIQEIPLATRKLLDRNGLRVGVVPAQMPPEFEKLLEPVALNPEEFDDWQKELHEQGLLEPVSPLLFHRKAQKRRGEVYTVTTSDVWPRQSWIIRTEDRRNIGVGNNVLCHWAVKTFPNNDGSVRLRLVPQIHHGDNRPQIGVEEQTFLFESGQSVVTLNELAIDVTIRPGESVVVGATGDMKELGRLFFRPQMKIKPDDYRLSLEEFKNPVPEGEQRILLVRLVQTQMDELFGWHGQ